MQLVKKYFRIFIPALGMFALILDSQTSLTGAVKGIDLCIRTVIPSIFPFLFFSSLITGTYSADSFRYLRPLGKLCRMPEGTEGILILGLLGGYPVGAQSISTLYSSGSISRKNAFRLLGFCSNAGPAFIFGMAGTLFTVSEAVWWLWAIHILSALTVGILLPGSTVEAVKSSTSESISAAAAMRRCVKNMANICGWIVLFRVIIAFLQRWFLWLIPDNIQVFTIGLLELANGCSALGGIQNEALRFVLASAFLGFGGICVGMQTAAVTESLGTGWYFPGKLLQCVLSVILALLAQPFIFPGSDLLKAYMPLMILLGCIFALSVLYINRKKAVAFSRLVVYNG